LLVKAPLNKLIQLSPSLSIVEYQFPNNAMWMKVLCIQLSFVVVCFDRGHAAPLRVDAVRVVTVTRESDDVVAKLGGTAVSSEAASPSRASHMNITMISASELKTPSPSQASEAAVLDEPSATSGHESPTQDDDLNESGEDDDLSTISVEPSKNATISSIVISWIYNAIVGFGNFLLLTFICGFIFGCCQSFVILAKTQIQ
jgi:hypothetical protein